jgi:glycosyltransferase involved in cell wall biosynthesis
MKIICFVDSLVSGGAQKQMTGLAILLRKENMDVELIYYNKNLFFQGDLDRNFVTHQLITGKGNFQKIFNLYKYIKSENPEVVISYLDSPNLIALFFKFIGLNFKLIVSERNTTVGPLSWKEKLKYLMFRYADVIVSNSYSQYSFISKNFPHLKKKLTVITNFVDTSAFIPDNSVKSNNKLKLISVGRINEQKNVLLFIDAIMLSIQKGLKVEVDWYGRYESLDYFNTCLQRISENNLSEIFKFFEPTTDIAKKYAQADVFCLPSIFEGTPNVVCEAMACGLPIICSDVCDNSQIIEDGVNGYLFDPLDSNSIAVSIEKVVDKLLVDGVQMGLESRRIAEEKFSQTLFIKRYKEIINN